MIHDTGWWNRLYISVRTYSFSYFKQHNDLKWLTFLYIYNIPWKALRLSNNWQVVSVVYICNLRRCQVVIQTHNFLTDTDALHKHTEQQRYFCELLNSILYDLTQCDQYKLRFHSYSRHRYHCHQRQDWYVKQNFVDEQSYKRRHTRNYVSISASWMNMPIDVKDCLWS